MYRFFVSKDQIQNGYVLITGPDVNHMVHVLRMKPGEEIRISDGSEDYYCIVRETGPHQVRAEVCYQEKGKTELPCRIYLFQGLPKGDKMEQIVQKAVELGAFQIVPVAMSRCVVKLDSKRARAKEARWQAIGESAAKQSKRILIPEVHPVVPYEKAVEMGKELDLVLFPYENAEGMDHTRKVLEGILPGQQVGIFIGPEGGFAKNEVEEGEKAGFHTITLGGRILRTETAGMALLAVLSYLLEGRKPEGDSINPKSRGI